MLLNELPYKGWLLYSDKEYEKSGLTYENPMWSFFSIEKALFAESLTEINLYIS
jgi:hypothetical protein